MEASARKFCTSEHASMHTAVYTYIQEPLGTSTTLLFLYSEPIEHSTSEQDSNGPPSRRHISTMIPASDKVKSGKRANLHGSRGIGTLQ